MSAGAQSRRSLETNTDLVSTAATASLPAMAAEPDDHVVWLSDWYAAQCDGVWEHSYGVTIGTLDNPGWTVKVDLSGTQLAGRAFEPVSYRLEGPNDTADAHWHSCRVAEGCFEGAGGKAHCTHLGTLPRRRWLWRRLRAGWLLRLPRRPRKAARACRRAAVVGRYFIRPAA